MRCAQPAATRPRVVHTVAELQMALTDKARGQRIAQLRKRKHLTQQAMAEKLKCGYRTYQTWEAGTMPEWPNLLKLAELLGVEPEHIIGEETAPPDPSQLDRIEASLAELLAAVRRLEGGEYPDPPDELVNSPRGRRPKQPPGPQSSSGQDTGARTGTDG